MFADDNTATVNVVDALRSVRENTASGVNIGSPVAATDPDRDTLTYRLVDLPGGTDAGAFTINNTGQLKTRNPLDHEMQASYTVMVDCHR